MAAAVAGSSRRIGNLLVARRRPPSNTITTSFWWRCFVFVFVIVVVTAAAAAATTMVVGTIVRIRCRVGRQSRSKADYASSGGASGALTAVVAPRNRRKALGSRPHRTTAPTNTAAQKCRDGVRDRLKIMSLFRSDNSRR